MLQGITTCISGLLALVMATLIVLSQITVEVEEPVALPPKPHQAAMVGQDRSKLPPQMTKKTSKPYFPSLYHFFNPETAITRSK